MAAESLSVNTRERYVCVTVDQGMLKPGGTLPTAGFHTDGLQSDEYSVKMPGDFQTISSDAAPTQRQPSVRSSETAVQPMKP